MNYRPLGQTGIQVSEIALGTMTWGQRAIGEREAHEQLDYAVAQGVNLVDTAEMYPMPPSPKTWGRSDEILGSWIAQSGKRDKIVLATKMMGRTSHFTEVREPPIKADARNIEEALTGSLRRLQTDYIDLFQLHWPDRKTHFFGQQDFNYEPKRDSGAGMAETLEALDKQLKAGRIRAIGLGNETPYGLCRFLNLAEQKNLPRVASIQNPYSLLNRLFEEGLAEQAYHGGVGLLAYSPIAGGALTGKYLRGRRPKGARLSNFKSSRFLTPKAEEATLQYVALAKRYDIDPAQMAIAFVLRQPFVASALIGASNLAQLRHNLWASEVTLSDDLLEGIREVHAKVPNPAPQISDRRGHKDDSVQATGRTSQGQGKARR